MVLYTKQLIVFTITQKSSNTTYHYVLLWIVCSTPSQKMVNSVKQRQSSKTTPTLFSCLKDHCSVYSETAVISAANARTRFLHWVLVTLNLDLVPSLWWLLVYPIADTLLPEIAPSCRLTPVISLSCGGFFSLADAEESAISDLNQVYTEPCSNASSQPVSQIVHQ